MSDTPIALESDQGAPPNLRGRRGWIAAALVLLGSPFLSMLYVGRPLRAGAYLAVMVLLPLAAFLLARVGAWPAGFSWQPFALLVLLAGAVDSYRIAKQHESGFAGPWFTTWKWLTAILLALSSVVIGVRQFVFEPFRTPSRAMLPTLHESDEFFVSKLAYRGAAPQRGDLLVFRLPSGITYIKRLIGLPGDTVVYDASSKRVTINGNVADLQRLGAYPDDAQFVLGRETIDGRSHSVLLGDQQYGSAGTYRVPADAYFVLGDNRDNSLDSRYAEFGLVPADRIVGKVTYVWWNTQEPNRAGTVAE